MNSLRQALAGRMADVFAITSREGQLFRYTCRLLLVPLIALSLSLAGCKQDAPDEVAQPPQVKVITITAAPVTITTQLPGRTSAYETSEVRPQVDGLIVERLFEEGDQVTAGQALYKLDAAPYQAKVASSKAALARARAASTSADSQARRYDVLVKTNAVSQQNHENAIASEQQARAEVLAQEAALQSAEIDLQRTTITAPISGRIGRSIVTVGGLAAAKQTSPLATIQRLDPIFVDIAKSSGELLRLRKAVMAGELSRDKDGTPVRLFLDDGTVYSVEGSVRFTDVSVDPSTNTQIVRARFPNPDELLLPGMYVRAELIEGVRAAAVLVPQRAVGRDEKGNGTVLLVTADGKLQSSKLRTERTVGTDWLVTSGLRPGDRVVIEGASGLQPGVAVRAIAWSQGDAGSAETPKQPN
jgi:membrane fusion protein (multidrug efflux system)